MLFNLLALVLLAIKVRSDGAKNGYRAATYFVDWAIYARNFTPQDLPADKLTHVLYAFANINSTTGDVYLADPWADTEKHFPGVSWNNGGTNVYGCFELFYLLKQRNRNLKVLLSVGGATYSANLANPAASTSGRMTFASSAVALIKNLGLDGIDVDWEYPENDAQASDFVLLLQAVREALDAYGNALNPQYHFQLTVACPAGPSHYQLMHLAAMDGYVDFWNLMAFDYAGSWSPLTANQANLFPSRSEPSSTPYNTEEAVGYYVGEGIEASKIVLGMPVYGRSFAATDGLGKPFTIDSSGTWQAGVYDFKELPMSATTYDNITGSSYSYNATSKELISYDDVPTAKQKAFWIKQMGLGGAMWWESSADRKGNDSLIQNVVNILGGDDGSELECSQNNLVYPNSTYENLRAGMLRSISAPLPLSTSAYSTSESCSPISVKATSATHALLSFTSNISSTSTSILTSSLTEATSFITKTVASLTGSLVSDTSTEASRSSTSVIPGVDGVPGCAYVLADDLGANALCSLDYCKCGGVLAPLLTSWVSGTLTKNCNYIAQPLENSCPTTISAPQSAPTATLTTAASTIISHSDAKSRPSSSANIFSSCTTVTLAASSSSITLPTSKPLLHPSVTLFIQTSSTSLSFASEPPASAADCVISGTSCNTYTFLACRDGKCTCGQDVGGHPTCFQEKLCADLVECSSNAECLANEACAVKSCCGKGGYCLPLAVGCLNSPVWKASPHPICKKVRRRSTFATAGRQIESNWLHC